MNLSTNAKKQHHSKKLWLAICVAVFIGLSVLGIVSVYTWQNRNLRPVSSQSSTIRVEIPLGATYREIGEILKQKGVIRSAFAFSAYVRRKELAESFKEGTFELDPSKSTQEIVDFLIGGEQASDLFTIPPGVRLDQVIKRLSDAGFSQSDIDAGLRPALYKEHPALVAKPRDASLEGYLYPESFRISSTTKVSDIVEQSLDEMDKRLTPERIAAFTRQGLTAHEAVILASVVEREVPQPDDRRVVAQIFMRRLREGIPLGADATYVYAAEITGQPAGPELDSPYNTRKYLGLPPGPISNVDESALDAVAYPASTNYLFFVSGDDGKNYWANTQEEHDQNIKNHCQVNCQ